MKIAFIDHYDSFSFNVINWLQTADRGLSVQRIGFDDAQNLMPLLSKPIPLVLSPGPKRPEDAASTVELVKALWGRVPILGICLGHQILAKIAGFTVKPLAEPVHGLTKSISIDPAAGIFSGLPVKMRMGVYNSLSVSGRPTDASCKILATDEQNEIQAMQFLGSPPIIGLQFHPESFLSEYGKKLAQNWLAMIDSSALNIRTSI